MNWLDVLGAVGGTAGVVSLAKVGIDVFMAKSGKTKVDVGNMQEMLNEAHKMFDEANKRYNALAKRFDEYKEESDKREEKYDKKIEVVENKVLSLERTVTQAYRCKYPDNIQDCPVVKAYEERTACDSCRAKEVV